MHPCNACRNRDHEKPADSDAANVPSPGRSPSWCRAHDPSSQHDTETGWFPGGGGGSRSGEVVGRSQYRQDECIGTVNHTVSY